MKLKVKWIKTKEKPMTGFDVRIEKFESALKENKELFNKALEFTDGSKYKV